MLFLTRGGKILGSRGSYYRRVLNTTGLDEFKIISVLGKLSASRYSGIANAKLPDPIVSYVCKYSRLQTSEAYKGHSHDLTNLMFYLLDRIN